MRKVDLTLFAARFVIAICAAVFMMSPVARATDNPEELKLQKTVTPTPDADGNYWLTLDAYVTGSIETVSEYPGLDVVLVLDVSSSLSSSEISTLRNAAVDFVTKLKEYKGDANIGVVTFSKGATKLTDGLVSAKDKGDELITQIKALTNTGDATYTNLGMFYGSRMILDLPKDDNRKRILLLFTDGEPTSSKSSTGKDRNPYKQAIDAINFSHEIKEAGCEVYSIAIGITEDNYLVWDGSYSKSPQTSDCISFGEFLSHVSSKYPKAYVEGTVESSSYTALNNIKKYWNSPVVSSPAYYQTVKNGETGKLAEIFEAISKDITHVPTIEVTERTVIKDGITKEFQLPEGIKASDIQTYTAAYAGVDGSGNPQWGALTTFAATKEISADRSTVTVTNFNYQDNWCGDNKGANHGKKLVIKFPIVPKDSTIGGLDIPTNTEDSGMYLDGEAVGYFPVPDLDLPKKLIIRKVGLNPGESAIFKVNQIQADKSYVELFTVMLTGIEGRSYVEKTVPNLAPEYDYNVTETDWSWSYTPSGSTSITTASDSANPLVFTNIKNNDIVKNAEAMVENKFGKISVTP